MAEQGTRCRPTAAEKDRVAIVTSFAVGGLGLGVCGLGLGVSQGVVVGTGSGRHVLPPRCLLRGSQEFTTGVTHRRRARAPAQLRFSQSLVYT